MKIEIKNRAKIRGLDGRDSLKEYIMRPSLPKILTNQTPDPDHGDSYDRAMAHLNK